MGSTQADFPWVIDEDKQGSASSKVKFAFRAFFIAKLDVFSNYNP